MRAVLVMTLLLIACAKNEPAPKTAATAPPAPTPAPAPSAKLDGDLDEAKPGDNVKPGAAAADSSLDEIAGHDADAPKIESGTTKSPTGEVTVGAASPSGIDQVVAKNRWRFKACYNTALASEPSISGSIAFKVTFDKDGAVSSVASTNVSVPQPLVACTTAAVQAMKAESTSVGTYTFVVTFAPTK